MNSVDVHSRKIAAYCAGWGESEVAKAEDGVQNASSGRGKIVAGVQAGLGTSLQYLKCKFKSKFFAMCNKILIPCFLLRK